MSADIHPEFHRQLDRAARERALGQRGVVLWLYGLSGSGKSTIAHALERRLNEAGRASVLLDGDNLRSGLNQGLGFSDEDRRENIRRAAEVARLLAQSGLIVVAAFVCPFRSLRALAREIVGADDFVEVHVSAPYAVCAERDPKGLYRKAAAGGVAQFTGRDSGFEEPTPGEGAFVLDTTQWPAEAAADMLFQRLAPRISSDAVVATD